MNHFEQHSSFYNSIIRLSEEEKANPLEVFQRFFRICDLPNARKTLLDMYENALTVDCTIFDQGQERHHLLWFYRSLESMLEAGQLLCQQPQKTAKPKKTRRRKIKI